MPEAFSRARRFQSRSQLPLISVVIPTRNEETQLPDTIRRARAVPEVSELIVVDGGSTDATRAVAASLDARVLTCPPGRGAQLQLGASQARGGIVLLLHADTWLPPEAGRALLGCLQDPAVVGGGFWKVFRDPPRWVRGERWRCGVRLWLTGRILGDQGFFVRRRALEAIGGVPDLPLMEEFELCRRLRPRGRLVLAPATVSTSARRFHQQGVIRAYLRLWRVCALYRLGCAPEKLRRIYEAD